MIVSTVHPVYDAVVERFNERDVDYWVDSGTLLGLVRDGSLLESDHDIDISAFDYEADSILAIGKEINGYRVHHRLYDGDVINIKYYPRSENDRMVDINLFERAEGYLRCPARLDVHNEYGHLNPFRYIYGLPRHLIYKLYFDQQYFAPELTARRCGNGLTHELAWWCFPEELIGTPTFSEEVNALLPEQVEEYLEYRYGEWEQPDDEWDSDNDDGAINLTVPPRE